MSKILRSITSDGSLVAFAIDSKDIVNKMCEIHKPSPVNIAALGRLLSAASIMGNTLKGDDDSITLRINGNGPSGTLIAVSDSKGNVRGLVSNPDVDLPLRSDNKLDVGSAVGSEGLLYVIRDLNLSQPYIGQTPLVSGEIAEDIANYFAISEQIPTVCALGVLVDRDLSCKAAGGYIIQLLPFADEEIINRLEKNIIKVKPVTSMLDSGISLEEMLKTILDGFEIEIIEEKEVDYICNCNRTKIETVLKSLGKSELEDMIEKQSGAEVICHFCKNKYVFDKNELMQFL